MQVNAAEELWCSFAQFCTFFFIFGYFIELQYFNHCTWLPMIISCIHETSQSAVFIQKWFPALFHYLEEVCCTCCKLESHSVEKQISRNGPNVEIFVKLAVVGHATLDTETLFSGDSVMASHSILNSTILPLPKAEAPVPPISLSL